jgi:hypothetical protein
VLIVGHLHHESHDSTGHGHAHDASGPPAEASATAAAVTARFDPDVWEVVTAEESHREMAGGDRATTLHDVVVRARRRERP